jgi:hypothetical protein
MDTRKTTGRDLRSRPAAPSRRQRARVGPRTRGRRPRGVPPIATGQDLSAPEPRRERRSVPRGAWVAIAAGGLAAALVLVQLRTESIDLRYRLASSMQSEQLLLEEQRRLTVEQQQLRHPVRLADLGRSLGLARPEWVSELAQPPSATAGGPP